MADTNSLLSASALVSSSSIMSEPHYDDTSPFQRSCVHVSLEPNYVTSPHSLFLAFILFWLNRRNLPYRHYNSFQVFILRHVLFARTSKHYIQGRFRIRWQAPSLAVITSHNSRFKTSASATNTMDRRRRLFYAKQMLCDRVRCGYGRYSLGLPHAYVAFKLYPA